VFVQKRGELVVTNLNSEISHQRAPMMLCSSKN
jgi:hypothetical protein